MQPTQSVRTDAATLSGLPAEAVTKQIQVSVSKFQLPVTPQRSFVDNDTIQGHGQAAATTAGSYLIPEFTASPAEGNRGPSVFGEFPNLGGSDLYPQQWQANSTVATNLPWCVYARPQHNMEQYISLSPGMPADQSTAYGVVAPQDRGTIPE